MLKYAHHILDGHLTNKRLEKSKKRQQEKCLEAFSKEFNDAENGAL